MRPVKSRMRRKREQSRRWRRTCKSLRASTEPRSSRMVRYSRVSSADGTDTAGASSRGAPGGAMRASSNAMTCTARAPTSGAMEAPTQVSGTGMRWDPGASCSGPTAASMRGSLHWARSTVTASSYGQTGAPTRASGRLGSSMVSESPSLGRGSAASPCGSTESSSGGLRLHRRPTLSPHRRPLSGNRHRMNFRCRLDPRARRTWEAMTPRLGPVIAD
mmetsp:Transcript_88729/g.197198  ORF Transcript_88729/g.197198 Transcript_88729/m.197198 type:complete len:218 (-) Transcript_88729:51-704(-)